VSVDEVPDATIEWPTDALIKITTSNISGSDLQMYGAAPDGAAASASVMTGFLCVLHV
jgi:threonine dehydrogenase-like Zn-dependent dehydrogenase